MIRARVTVTKRTQNWDAVEKVVAKLRGASAAAEVGVFDQSPREGGMTNAQVAAVHEFGSSDGHVPERSFIRSTLSDNRGKYAQVMASSMRRILERAETLEGAVANLGGTMVRDIQAKVTTGAGIPPPLADSTIKRKDHSLPLVDTRQMLNAVTWRPSRA